MPGPNNQRTHYDVLGLRNNATTEEIRDAYRSLVKKLHPDVSDDPRASDKFIELQNAYEILGDRHKKAVYDTELLNAALAAKRAAPAPRPKNPPKPKPKSPEIPADHTADILRMVGFLGQGRIAEAEKLAKRVSSAAPRHAVPYAVLGDAARLRGELADAAKHYAMAAQMDPRNSTYLRKHEEVMAAISQLESRRVNFESSRPNRAMPAMVGLFVLLSSGLYVLFSGGQPMMPAVTPINTWTTGLFVMLILVGITFGAVLALSGALTPFRASHSTATMTFSPPVLLGIIAVVNFWFAAFLYGLIAAMQDSFNRSTSRVIAMSALITVFFALISAVTPSISGWQVIIWGGNLVYVSALCGWMVTDGLATA